MIDDDQRGRDIQDIKERLTRIEVMLDNTLTTRKLELDKMVEQLKSFKSESDYKDNELSARITKLENANIWLWRTVFGGIIAFILEFFLKIR